MCDRGPIHASNFASLMRKSFIPVIVDSHIMIGGLAAKFKAVG